MSNSDKIVKLYLRDWDAELLRLWKIRKAEEHRTGHKRDDPVFDEMDDAYERLWMGRWFKMQRRKRTDV